MPASSDLNLISLASGYGSFSLPEPVAQQVQRALTRLPLPTSPAEGLPELRQALAHRYQAQAATVVPGDIVVTPGTKAALFLLLATVLRPGDEVLLLSPNWFGFAELIRQAGATLRELPLHPADNYQISPDAVQAAIGPRTRLLLFTNPNNPTGRVYTRPELAALLAVTQQHPQLLVLADEIYDGIRFGPEPVPTLLSFPDPLGQHLVVNGFSKSLALLGWNIGYLVAPSAVAQACTARQFATGGAVAALSQLAALAATEATTDITQELHTGLLTNRQLLLDFLATLPGALPALPLGTYYAFPDLRAFLDPALAPEQASADLVARLHAAGVAVVDGATCGAPGFVRLSYAVPEAELREAIRRMAQVLR
ncbi:pyridoxal phosphate-dependent aminotransferase [Hymenobacter canadensis]|uniref:Aminotransferase class I/II-fold pyridoxal phosphate-dependent enzyme n=1 Tax=Hymenobacter canadensis TaxID=2999067 RepID=A0ABY7LUM3_9BACT|nr:aminotransferase class I/II-fold pyridoxal phosphate-dependent enzyme [Hymenobacter canadensis]WBA43617.1 aminotransferase class I/II-fold pyridoxal phosphate-dependent enzyme [Hymenobacter canadensis]